MAATLTVLGRLLREDGRPADAEAALLEAKAIALRRLDESDPARERIERELELLNPAISNRARGSDH